ncbi:radical SAM protein [Actinomadura nitritigenes]|uniref:radical SAM protein n=1 Tax=Actinomadura nitritigenes TaxID=134602 RepID=UPI003D8D39F3
MTTTTIEAPRTASRLLWLDLTRKCQLNCTHCSNSSGPDGDHGTMTRADWLRVLNEAASAGVDRVQLIGGEPTMHPDALDIARLALALGLDVEVYSNLVHIGDDWWELFAHDRVSVATSYYAADAAAHNAVTGRPSHQRTRSNIIRAISAGVRLRVGIVTTGDDTQAERAAADLRELGVTDIRVDRVRPLGRAAAGEPESPAGLCGRCGDGRVAVGPTGEVSPCFMSSWMSVGNVQQASLAAIVGGAAMAEATTSIRAVTRPNDGCDPDDECSPGHPGSGCNPRT